MSTISRAENLHILIAGKRNAGKSSLINCLANRELFNTSKIPGTTTDPVSKSVELSSCGPVVIIDTAGIDNEGELSKKRISGTVRSVSNADFAVIVLDARNELDGYEVGLITFLRKAGIPFIAAVNKIEFGINPCLLNELKALEVIHFEISCGENAGIDHLKRKLIRLLPDKSEAPLIGDLIRRGDVVVMVVPNDTSALKRSLIKLQVQSLREALDADTICLVVKDKEFRSALSSLKNPPGLVIADNRAIMHILNEVPDGAMLTTFSILAARQKGNISEFVRGLKKIKTLESGDKILIAEACTRASPEDHTETAVITHWLKQHTMKDLIIDVKPGFDFPDSLFGYKLIVHRGESMLTRRMMQVRIKQAKLMDVPIVSYDLLISYMHGCVPRVIEPFDEAIEEWLKLSADPFDNIFTISKAQS